MEFEIVVENVAPKKNADNVIVKWKCNHFFEADELLFHIGFDWMKNFVNG